MVLYMIAVGGVLLYMIAMGGGGVVHDSSGWGWCCT